MRSLRELKQGEKGIIANIRGKGEFRKRIIEMGFIKGKMVTVIKAAPLQDPVEYRILDSNVSLRLEEAALIDVINEEDAVYKNGLGFDGITETENFKKHDGEKTRLIKVALLGNPNSGKTSLFNHASHSREHVGNYAGVTVDSKTAKVKIDGYTIDITDLPGTYSLSYYSPEELFIRQHLSQSGPDVVINVIDASNLERNLYLTTQLIDMGLRVVVALNMFDEMRLKGDIFDYKTLGKMTGIPFIPTIASKGKGVQDLFEKIIEIYEERDPFSRRVQINYGFELEQSIERIKAEISEQTQKECALSPRYLAIKLLEKDKQTHVFFENLNNLNRLKEAAEKEILRLEHFFREDTESLIAGARYGFIEGALKETYRPADISRKTITRRIDHFLTGKYLGYPIFILLMWLMFQATFVFGDYPVLLIEKLVEWIGNLVNKMIPEGIVNDLVIDGIIGGVGGVIIFLPNILILFLFISLMEDTGYMSRVAFIVDKLMHKVGLHGKSFIPLLMGFGCNVPAIMATRTIENKNDRLVTMLIIPFMSCSARYPVYVLLISAFFVSFRGSILFLLYLIGIAIAALVAFLLKNTLFKAREIPFVMELPPYRMPTLKAIVKHTWFKGAQYLKKMGTIILVASVIIWALGYFPRNKAVNESYQSLISQAENESKVHELKVAMIREQQGQSFIGRIGRFIEPAIQPLGFDWRMGVSLVAGSAAKEVVVSTMGVLYQSGDDEGVTGLISKLQTQVHTSGPRLGEPVYTPLIAFSFMIFILIYFPCIAVIAAIRKESGKWKWPAFLALYTTALAWIASFAVYQIGRLL
jgi:ferrous iron transport protein B